MSIKELCIYLNRAKADYPYGVPNYVPSSDAQRSGYVFIYKSEAAAEEFLTALVEKGLKSQRSDHDFITITAVEDLQLCLESKNITKRRGVVVFDEMLAKDLPLLNAPILLAPTISQISANPAAKKSFWKNLQAL